MRGVLGRTFFGIILFAVTASKVDVAILAQILRLSTGFDVFCSGILSHRSSLERDIHIPLATKVSVFHAMSEIQI
jgi:hypothetical protein